MGCIACINQCCDFGDFIFLPEINETFYHSETFCANKTSCTNETAHSNETFDAIIGRAAHDRMAAVAFLPCFLRMFNISNSF